LCKKKKKKKKKKNLNNWVISQHINSKF